MTPLQELAEKRCVDCKHYSYNWDSDTDGHLSCEWVECDKRPALANLKQFPFQRTSCADWKSRPALIEREEG